tara:strand:- start:354 stop:581 length:228 start_codon:yes stop_codon:yes gene_type:complete
VSHFQIGDLVEVKRNNSLSPALRFFYNNIGIIISLVAESQKNGRVYMREYKVIFDNGRHSTFKDYELRLVAPINK